MRGRWGSTLAKWAGKIVPGLQVVLAVVDLFVAGVAKRSTTRVK
jgi:hypothetical protein